MSAAPTKVLVLGIDAASPDLLSRWALDGTMPNLAALMQRGLTGETRSLEGFFIASTWPSLYTGVTPARHGFHYTIQVKPGTYQYQYSSLMHDGFWSHLHRAGKRVALIDVPLSRVDPDLNGIHIVDWSGIEATFGFDTSPPALRHEIAARFGPYPLRRACDGLRRGAGEFGELVSQLELGVRKRADLALHYLAAGGWDFFMPVFTEAHCAGHQCWHLHDPAHPAHDPAIAAAIGDPLRRVYAAIDRAIGQIVAAAGDARIVVFSAHGMHHWYGAQGALPNILHALGVAQAPSVEPAPTGPGPAAVAAARWLWHMVPQPLREALYRLRTRAGNRFAGPPSLPGLDVDVRTSRCFVVRNGHATGGIRLNLIGREPNGVLAPGPAAEAFCAELTRDLLDITDERTGRPVARRVVRTKDLYTGERLDELPDLLVEWDDAVATGSVRHANGAGAMVRLHSAKIGTIAVANEYTRTGDHRIGGLFVAAGPGIRPGRLDRVVSIMDLAPTFTALVGVEMPGVDGRPIPELLSVTE